MVGGSVRTFRSNRPSDELWSRDGFGSSLSVAISEFMRSKRIPANYIRTFGCNKTEVTTIQLGDVYGKDVPDESPIFDFDSYPERYSEYAKGLLDMGLIVRGTDRSDDDIFDIKATVVPDSSTCDCDPEDMGPEITIRLPTLMHCALSIYEGIREERQSALDILEPVCGRIRDWSDCVEISEIFEELRDCVEKLENSYISNQKPVMIQTVWRTRGMDPILEENAMDLFVWSDHALTRLFLDSARRGKNGSITRPMRCTVRLVRILYELLRNNKPDLGKICAETTYGISNGKEMMVNGKASNAYMRCSRLAKPIILSKDIPDIIPTETESIIIPERRLDQTMYYSIFAAKPNTF